MKHLKQMSVALLVLGFLYALPRTDVLVHNTAGTFWPESVNAEKLQERYRAYVDGDRRTLRQLGRDGHGDGEVRILIVPGHDDVHSGAHHNGVDEVELNRELGKYLFNFLKDQEGIFAMLASTEKGYHPDLQEYFDYNASEISDFQLEYKKEMNRLIESGDVDLKQGVFHNAAPGDVAFKLYGINKWANENDIDITIHIHFNDHPGRRAGQYGKYNGFAIYVPDGQFSNGSASQEFAKKLAKRIGLILPQSNLPKESGGVVEDQELIAIGANNTSEGISILIEYGYIYENAFTEPTLRPHMLRELAYQTSLGIQEFFGKNISDDESLLTKFRVLNENVFEGAKDNPTVLTLQALLRLDGYYPPAGKTLNDCPISGTFGPCTKEAVEAFQKKNGINATGFVGEGTREALLQS